MLRVLFILLCVLGGVVLLLALALLALLKRSARLCWALAALWGALAVMLAVGFGTKQIYDAAIVQEAAELFARGNYKMMRADYLNAYPYQLGVCLPMETLLRLFPGLNLNLTMQLANVAMALGTAAAMAALGQTMFDGERTARACEAVGLLVWPALLFCQQALKELDLPANNLIAITMPGFGTTDRTYYNALSLISALGADNRDISIKASVLQHFEDIGHDPSVRDVTYENAQARERTQILMDVANSCRGLVVGTGDMSEDALGWCTFGGDHLANYNVNVCLTKTMIRRMVTHLCSRFDEQIGSILHDIVDTPVSPELLPPDESGKIQQKTEDILGNYALHDFFLYYLLRYNFPPRKLYYYACLAFSGELSASYILEKLKLFLHRFFAGQFKRSCTPDSARITDVNLTCWSIPSDASAQSLLCDLDEIR